MQYIIQPKGVCSKNMILEIEQDKIKSVEIIGGCAGNSAGIARLLEGMEIKEVIKRLKGIKCGVKPTSCPDQLAIGLEKIIENERKGEV